MITRSAEYERTKMVANAYMGRRICGISANDIRKIQEAQKKKEEEKSKKQEK